MVNIKRTRLTCLLWLTALIGAYAVKPSAASQTFLSDWMQTVYADDERVPLSKANHILQTKDGYIWIGGFEGLVRYDGIKSKKFNEKEDGFPAYQINTMYESKNGDLWIGTNDEGVILYKDDEFTVFNAAKGVPSQSIRSFAEDSMGNVYVATSYGIALITPEYNVHLITNQRQNPISAVKVAITQKDELWCVAEDGNVYVMNMESVLTKYEPGYFGGYGIISVFCSSNNDVYLGTTQSQTIKIEKNGFAIMDAQTRTGINSLYEDDSGRIWVLADNGTGYFEKGEFHSIDGALIQNNIRNMIEDYEGNYWFSSSSKGVLHLVRSKFRNVNFAAGLPERTVNTTCPFNNEIYIGTNEGLYILDEKGKPVGNSLFEKLKSVCINDIATVKGDLWISTYSDYGLVQYKKDGSIRNYTTRDGLLSSNVRRVTNTTNDLLVISTMEGINVMEDGKVMISFTSEDGLLNKNVVSFSEDTKGLIYLGTDGGGIFLLDLDKGKISNLTKADGLLSDVILRLRYDKYKDGMWIACSNGLCFMDKNGIVCVDKLEEYSAGILDIRNVTNDAIWFLTANRVLECNKYNLFSEEPLQIKVWDKHDGLTSSITKSGRHYMDKKGTLYLSCAKGVWSIDTKNVYHNETVPKISVNQVTIDGKAYTNMDNLAIPSGAKRVTIDYALLSYLSLSGKSVKYMLEGFDEDWVTVDADTNSSVSYTNLKGGRYRFRIQGTNKEGMVSETIEIAMKKERGFMEKTMVRLAVVLGFILICIGIGTLFLKGRIRMLQKKYQREEAFKKQAMKAIADVIDEKIGNVVGHSNHIADYAMEVAKRLGFSKKNRERLYYSALFHDADKLGEECGDFTMVHELLDDMELNCEGEGSEDSLIQNIIDMVEFYETMTSEYAVGGTKEGEPIKEKVLEAFKNGAGVHYDNELVDAMIQALSK